MKVEVQDLSSVEKKVTVEIPAERVKDEFELAFKDLQKTAHLKGFRPGKAPMKLLESHFKDYIREKVMRKLLEETLSPALERKQLKPITEPAIDLGELKEGSAFSYTLEVEIKPVVELKQYQGLELEREVVEVTEKMVERAVQELRERQAVFQEPKQARPAQTGDLLTLDLKAELEGKPLPGEGGAGIQYSMGGESYIPGLADALSGIQAGDKRNFKAIFPKDHYRPELAGKEVSYTAELKGLKEKILPELNDDFAKEVGGHKDLVELEAKVREQLEKYYQRAGRVKLERSLLDKLVELNPLEAPKRLAAGRAREVAEQWLARMGIKEAPPEQLEPMIAETLPRAERELKAGFILEAVIEKEGIKLDADKEEAKLKEMAERYQMDPSKLKDQLGKDALDRLRSQWLEETALDFLLSGLKIKDKQVKPNENEMDKGTE